MKFENIMLSKKILYDVNIPNFISSNSNSNLTIIYFSNHINDTIQKLNIKKNNIIFVTQHSMSPQYFSFKHVNANMFKHLSHKVMIAIDIDDKVSFKYMKYLIKNLIHLFKILKRRKIKLNYTYNNFTILSILSCQASNPFFGDICTTFKALLSNSKKKQYEIIYDYVCTYLDNEFTCKNICGFSNNICAASRAGLTQYKINGCCYTIEYGPGGIILDHKPCKYLVDKHCVASCISCKLHTCYFLKMKNIEYKIKNILLLNCFFSHKQWFVLKYNVFKTKEEILEKLLHVKFIPSIFYYPLSLYKIN